MVRIFVRGISNGITNSDINGLFSKLHIVEEVYIPSSTITGIHRNFAIVVLKIEDKDEIKKCIQTLNGSLWKGIKLRLELANEWYKDRLDKERLQSLQDLNVKIDFVDESVILKSLPTISNDSIRLKHNSKEYHISMQPNILLKNEKPLSSVNDSSNMISCGNKRVFSNDSEQYEYTSNDEISDYEIPSKSIKLVKENDRMKSLNKINNKDNDKLNDIKQHPIVKCMTAIGGGMRKGFGNLVITKDNIIPMINSSSIDCCIEAKDQNQFINSSSNNNNSNIRKLHKEEIDSSEDDEPCLKMEDISDEALQKERERTVGLFNKFFKDNDETNEDTKHIIHNIDKELGNIDMKSDIPLSTNTNIINQDEILVHTKDGYANINQLKNIFYREGGVWWGDDGTLKGAVGKGDIALDPIFLEAEKHGIDIRKHSMNNNNMNMNSINDSNDEIDDKNAPMVFSFFDSLPENEDLNPFLSTTTTKNINNENNNIVTNTNSKTKGTTKETMIILDNSLNQNIEVLVDITSKELISIGKKFTRITSINDITEQWRNERDRYILDYKRKTRDMKRRTAVWNNKVSLTNNHHSESNSNNNTNNNINNNANNNTNKQFTISTTRTANTIHYNRKKNKSSNKHQKIQHT